MAAVTQIRFDTPGRDYYQRKIAEGNTRLEALRSLKRRVTDAVFRQLQVDRQMDQTQDDAWPRRASTRLGSPRRVRLKLEIVDQRRRRQRRT